MAIANKLLLRALSLLLVLITYVLINDDVIHEHFQYGKNTEQRCDDPARNIAANEAFLFLHPACEGCTCGYNRSDDGISINPRRAITENCCDKRPVVGQESSGGVVLLRSCAYR